MTASRTCTHPDGCPRPHKASGFCRPHWDRWRKTGDVGSVLVATRAPLSRNCRAEGCDDSVGQYGGKGLCNKHYQRLRTHGDESVIATGGASLALSQNPNWSGDEASYSAVHARLRRHRGRAADHVCVDCAGPASHWSYAGSVHGELTHPEFGRYSTDLAAYEPRCVSCHKRFDNAMRVALLTGERPDGDE